jgi:methylated-DNA-[protein]-cysteine S-methyltransferase
MTTLYARYSSPLGELLLVGERTASGPMHLCGVHLPGERHGPSIEPSWVEDGPAFATVSAALDAYFRGERTAFDLRLEPRGTAFQLRVWAELERIPFGETVTYGEIASRIGRPGAARAVGAAAGRNPLSIVVPCHRVVGADGALTGYAGGLDRKARLLDHERGVIAGQTSVRPGPG